LYFSLAFASGNFVKMGSGAQHRVESAFVDGLFLGEFPVEVLLWDVLDAKSDEPSAETAANGGQLHGQSDGSCVEDECGPVVGRHEVLHVEFGEEHNDEPPVGEWTSENVKLLAFLVRQHAAVPHVEQVHNDEHLEEEGVMHEAESR